MKYIHMKKPPRLHLMEALPYYHCTISWKPFMTWLWMNCNQVTTSFHLSFVNSHLLSSLCCLGQVSLLGRYQKHYQKYEQISVGWFLVFYKDFWVQVQSFFKKLEDLLVLSLGLEFSNLSILGSSKIFLINGFNPLFQLFSILGLGQGCFQLIFGDSSKVDF